ncbi:uncharacterized protein UTRI_06488 [Ustilago trichophora]|uniref:RRN6 K-rich C-terminal domain-containing protein n=1 Tax=Ustilago trichophora TaxID=86804 RepID=A0A5C3ELD5_9BASI|nr:uncharacterized protein UTRI_06488 [Ustilago trichophora]
MEAIPTGSRGAVRLHVQGSCSNDDPGTLLISSQQWSFPAQHVSRAPTFRLSRISTQAGASTRTQLTPPTVPPSLDRHSLYPRNEADAGSSVDADILAAHHFLRQHHPDVEIPDHILSNTIYENAASLADTAHELDGSLGIADTQAIAVLGPVTFQQRHIYAIVCIGGYNRDCLLLHQLEIHSGDEVALGTSTSKQPASAQAKGKAKAIESTRVLFIPAHNVERKYRTPILQVIASTNNSILAVRSHSNTSFLSLKHRDRGDRPPRLHLETMHQLHYGIDGTSQHQEVCFSYNDPALAAVVDRLGNIELLHFQAELQPPRHDDSSSNSPVPNPPMGDALADGSPALKSTDRRSFPPTSLPLTSKSPQPSSVVSVRRISAHLLAQAAADIDADAPAADASIAEDTLSSVMSPKAPFGLAFGHNDSSLILLTQHSLIHIKLEDHGASSDAAGLHQVSTILRSNFCLTSFRRAKFFSMASCGTSSNHPLLAVCSSDAIYWFDLKDPSKPLFSTAHHRGDDPTLTLIALPHTRSGAAATSHADGDANSWALCSRRNDMISCYTVRSRRQDGPDYDLSNGLSDADSTAVCWKHALDEAPVLVPLTSSASQRHRPAAPPLFFDATDGLHQDSHFDSWITFEITERGALLAQILQVSLAPPSTKPAQSGPTLDLEIMQPSLDTLLYLCTDQTDAASPLHGHIDSLSDVKTRILNLEKLHRALFSTQDFPATDASHVNDTGNSTARRLDAQSTPSNGHASVYAATLSLGQLFRDYDKCANANNRQDAEESIQASKPIWSTALEIGTGEEAQTRTLNNILDLRSDVRHALSSLSVSRAQEAWSRAATAVSSCDADGSLDANGRSSSPVRVQRDVLKHALGHSIDQADVAPYLPTKESVEPWCPRIRRAVQKSLRDASRRMMLDLALEAEIFVRPKARILDEGAPTQRPQQRQGTNWTALEHRDIYNFVEEQGDKIPPPHVGSVGLSFFAPLRSGEVTAAVGTSDKRNGVKKGLDEVELEALLPSTSSTARLLLAEWQLGEDATEYTYLDPFEGLHRLPRASRLRGPTARARSRSFSRASSASTEDRSRSRSRSRKQSAAPSLSQLDAFASQGPPSSYPPSLVSQSQPAGASGAPPTLASRRKRPDPSAVSRSQPLRSPMQGFEHALSGRTNVAQQAFSTAQSQPAPPKFGFAGTFGDLTPTASPTPSRAGTPTQQQFGASTQIEAGRFGARPVKTDRPPKKKKRASGF